jgi:hypothetical protein
MGNYVADLLRRGAGVRPARRASLALEVDAEGTYIHAQGRLPDPREYLAGAASAQFSRRSLA